MNDSLTISFLGGLGEIGRNCTVLEVDDQFLVIDCGIKFPGTDEPGVDVILPDLRHLERLGDRVIGVVATHGHEDHVGGISHLLRRLDHTIPVYGTPFTLRIAANRIIESGLSDQVELVEVSDGERVPIGPFEVEFLPITHSIPGANALAIRTPQGVVFHTGDFKLDRTPVDNRPTDEARMEEIRDTEGIRLLLCDSTNAEEEGWSRSEADVGPVMDEIFADRPGKRIIVASFASHIHRIQQVVTAARAHGRIIATVGISMHRNLLAARELGLIDLRADEIIDSGDIDSIDPGRLCILSTGTQAEPRSAIGLMAIGENRWVKVGPNDTVVMSSTAIPGNEVNVAAVIDELMRQGVEVITDGIDDVHTTGHGQADELAHVHGLTSPEWFIPVHGEYRMLQAHRALAVDGGLADDHIFVSENGDRLVIDDDGMRRVQGLQMQDLLVDGKLNDVGPSLLKERTILGNEGIVTVIVAIDAKAKKLVTGPEIVTRGWLFVPDNEDLLVQAEEELAEEVERLLGEGETDAEAIERRMRRTLGRFVSDSTSRRPMLVPVVLHV